MKNLTVIILLSIITYGCLQKPSQAVSQIEVDGKKVNLFRFEEVKDSIVLNLTDLADDFHFIRLETNPSCLLNRPNFYIGKNYILSFERGQPVFQFDAAGNYVRTIASQGEGPQEVTGYLWAVDEQSNILYIKDDPKDHFLSFDLNTGKYLKDIPLAVPGWIVQFMIPGPGLLAIVPALNRSILKNRYYVYRQNTSGDFLGGLVAPPDFKINPGSPVLFQNSESAGYYYSSSDTLFTLTDQGRVPDWIFKLKENNPDDRKGTGSRTLRIITSQKNFILASVFVTDQTTNRDRVSVSTGKLYYLFFDKKNRAVHYISKLMATDLGQPVRPVLMRTQADGTLYLSFNAVDLKEMIAKTLRNPDIGPDLRNKLSALDSQITENDNPIILTGKIRD